MKDPAKELKGLWRRRSRSDRDIKGFADPFHRSEAEGVLCEDAEDKTEAVAAVRDDGIREEGMCCGRISAERTDEARTVFTGLLLTKSITVRS